MHQHQEDLRSLVTLLFFHLFLIKRAVQPQGLAAELKMPAQSKDDRNIIKDNVQDFTSKPSMAIAWDIIQSLHHDLVLTKCGNMSINFTDELKNLSPMSQKALST